MYASKNTHKNENVNTQMWIRELSVSARVCASVFTRDRLKGEKGKTRDKESEKQSEEEIKKEEGGEQERESETKEESESKK